MFFAPFSLLSVVIAAYLGDVNNGSCDRVRIPVFYRIRFLYVFVLTVSFLSSSIANQYTADWCGLFVRNNSLCCRRHHHERFLS